MKNLILSRSKNLGEVSASEASEKLRTFVLKYWCQKVSFGALLHFPSKIVDCAQENLQISKKVLYDLIASEAKKFARFIKLFQQNWSSGAILRRI